MGSTNNDNPLVCAQAAAWPALWRRHHASPQRTGSLCCPVRRGWVWVWVWVWVRV